MYITGNKDAHPVTQCTDSLPTRGVANLATCLPGPQAKGKTSKGQVLTGLSDCCQHSGSAPSRSTRLQGGARLSSAHRQLKHPQPLSLFGLFSLCCLVQAVSRTQLPQKQHSVPQTGAVLILHQKLQEFKAPKSLFCLTKQEAALRNGTCPVCKATLPCFRRVFNVRTKTTSMFSFLTRGG